MTYSVKTMSKGLGALMAALLALQSGDALATDIVNSHFKPAVALPEDSGEFANAISDKELEHDRGTGTPTIFNLSNLSANLNGNNAIDTISGANNIADSALSGVNGIDTFIQNSGNNVVIQSSTIVNMTFCQQANAC